MRIDFKGPCYGLDIVRELLSPWDVTFTDHSHAETTIAYGTLPETEKSVVVPAEATDFLRKAKANRSSFEIVPGKRVKVEICSQICLTLTPSRSFRYEKWMDNKCSDTAIADPAETSKVYLTIDVIHEFRKGINRILNPKSSRAVKFMSYMPLSYSIAPKQLRDLLMKQRTEDLRNQFYCDHFSMDALRFILA